MNDTPRVSRRSLAKGAAWAAPAVVVSGVVPAYAASPACEPIEPRPFNEPNAWTIESPVTGKLVKASSNRAIGLKGGELWWSMTSAIDGDATLRLSAVYEAREGAGASFDTRCGLKNGKSRYKMRVGLSSLQSKSNTAAGGKPIDVFAVMRVYDPDGKPYQFSFKSGDAGKGPAIGSNRGSYKAVPYAKSTADAPTAYQDWEFEITPGAWRFVVDYYIPSSGTSADVSKFPANGLAFTAPTFTPVS